MDQSAYKKETGTEATYSAQKEQAITTLMNLQLAGFSEKEINELIGLVNRWSRG